MQAVSEKDVPGKFAQQRKAAIAPGKKDSVNSKLSWWVRATVLSQLQRLAFVSGQMSSLLSFYVSCYVEKH